MSEPICGPLIHNFLDEKQDQIKKEKEKNMFLWKRIKTENEKIFYAVEKKNREGKGGKYLEKAKKLVHGGDEERRRKIYGEGNLMVKPTNRPADKPTG